MRTIGEELRAIRQLLERVLAPADEPKPQPGSAPAVAAPAEPAPPRLSETQLLAQLTHLLGARRLQLSQYQQVQYQGPLDEEMYHLGMFMSEHYPIVAPFLAELRATLSQPRRIYSALQNDSPEDIATLTNIGTRLYRLRILYQYRYERAQKQIMAWVDASPESRNYLAGGWFEMGVYRMVQKVLRTLSSGQALVLRNVQLNGAGGGCCEVDILIYLHNGGRRLVLLECKSAPSLTPEDISQIRRTVSLLNLSVQRAAVVFPMSPPDHCVDRWLQQTGANIIGFPQLELFLRKAVA